MQILGTEIGRSYLKFTKKKHFEAENLSFRFIYHINTRLDQNGLKIFIESLIWNLEQKFGLLSINRKGSANLERGN